METCAQNPRSCPRVVCGRPGAAVAGAGKGPVTGKERRQHPPRGWFPTPGSPAPPTAAHAACAQGAAQLEPAQTVGQPGGPVPCSARVSCDHLPFPCCGGLQPPTHSLVSAPLRGRERPVAFTAVVAFVGSSHLPTDLKLTSWTLVAVIFSPLGPGGKCNTHLELGISPNNDSDPLRTCYLPFTDGEIPAHGRLLT